MTIQTATSMQDDKWYAQLSSCDEGPENDGYIVGPFDTKEEAIGYQSDDGYEVVGVGLGNTEDWEAV